MYGFDREEEYMIPGEPFSKKDRAGDSQQRAESMRILEKSVGLRTFSGTLFRARVFLKVNIFLRARRFATQAFRDRHSFAGAAFLLCFLAAIGILLYVFLKLP